MGRNKLMGIAGLAILLAGCGGEKPAAVEEPAAATKLTPGLYEVN